MKNLFNNPWFVGALALSGIVYLVIQVMGYLPEDASALGEYSAELFDPEFIEQAESLAGSDFEGAGHVDRKLIDWLQSPPRDPFRSQTRQATPALAAAHAEPERKRVIADAIVLPRLQAVFKRGEDASAVVNGTLVSVGDHIDGFRVSGISPEHVAVTRAGRHYTLSPDQQ